MRFRAYLAYHIITMVLRVFANLACQGATDTSHGAPCCSQTQPFQLTKSTHLVLGQLSSLTMTPGCDACRVTRGSGELLIHCDVLNIDSASAPNAQCCHAVGSLLLELIVF